MKKIEKIYNKNIQLILYNMPKEKPEILSYFLEDLLEWEHGYKIRSMFSSFAIYKFWKIFAILDREDQFYFKVWENNINDYLKFWMKAFQYEKKWIITKLCYYTIPEHILEDKNELKIWIDKSLTVENTKKKKVNKDIKNQVLEYLKTIPKTKVTTYKNLSQKFQLHSRTIASIMKQNQNQDIFPCYKVIMNDGSLGWYNLWIDEKIKKLKNDWIEIINDKIDKKYFI